VRAAVLGGLAGLLLVGVVRADADALIDGFREPPAAARPRVWWHWMNGNVTQEGISRDLAWMNRVGLGGVQLVDAALRVPQIVDERLVFMSPGWCAAFRHAVATAKQRNLDLLLGGSPGWSQSGGPWVEPEQAMKKLVWSETRVAGGHPFKGRLRQPPTTTGPFQNVALANETLLSDDDGGITPQRYADAVVIAFRRLESDRKDESLQPQVTGSIGDISAAALADGDLEHALVLPYGTAQNPAYIQWDYGQPRQISAVSLALQGSSRFEFLVDPTLLVAELRSSDDGLSFRRVVQFFDATAKQMTRSFAPQTARYFRLVFPAAPGFQLDVDVPGFTLPKRVSARVAEAVLYSGLRVNRFEEKAGFFIGKNLDAAATPQAAGPQAAGTDVIPGQQILNLTDRLRPDGSLDWTPPPGDWVVLRAGYSLIGIRNHPAPPEATGLEVDKLSARHVRNYFETYLARYATCAGLPVSPTTQIAQGLDIDSWEAGAQNWTDEMPAQFAQRRGYALWRWLPALTGRIVNSAAATDAFLFDYRQTLGEMLVDNHHSQIANIARAHGMTVYGESHESGRAFVGDGMDAKRVVDVPMGAMWVGSTNPTAAYDSDLRESASTSHLYGKPYVAAESLTAGGPAFAVAPSDLKATADREFIDGVNQVFIHASVHQPLDDHKPGFTLGPFGQYFTRHETWAEQAGPWIKYLTRSAYLLQQGRPVADVLYYYGDDSNVTAEYGKALPVMPEGHDFDFASSHALSLLAVKDGRLTTRSGMSYRMLVLDPRTRLMTLATLRRIAALVRAGATVVGDKPQRSPSLADDAATFGRLAESLWNGHGYGRGRVLTQRSVAQALADIGVPPDFSYAGNHDDTALQFVHRQLDDGELYFISNRQNRGERVELSFRVVGKAPELWYADTGQRLPASYRIEGGRTVVPVTIDPQGAFFVLFRQSTTALQRDVPESRHEPITTLQGAWKLEFESGRGAPAAIELPALMSWTDHADAGVKYFSGTASYQREMLVPAEWLHEGRRIEIDLGVVKNLAEVRVNGQSLGVLWKAPFRLELTDALHAGVNQLEVRVTNLWPNRMIGDKQPGAAKLTFSTLDPYKADSPLLPSGLLGPVLIESLIGPAAAATR
jgi:hypothetical protein